MSLPSVEWRKGKSGLVEVGTTSGPLPNKWSNIWNSNFTFWLAVSWSALQVNQSAERRVRFRAFERWKALDMRARRWPKPANALYRIRTCSSGTHARSLLSWSTDDNGGSSTILLVGNTAAFLSNWKLASGIDICFDKKPKLAKRRTIGVAPGFHDDNFDSVLSLPDLTFFIIFSTNANSRKGLCAVSLADRFAGDNSLKRNDGLPSRSEEMMIFQRNVFSRWIPIFRSYLSQAHPELQNSGNNWHDLRSTIKDTDQKLWAFSLTDF